MIKEGDKVRILSKGYIYSTIFKFLAVCQDSLVAYQESHLVTREVLSKYVYGRLPDSEDMEKEWTVYYIGNHPMACFTYDKLALIGNNEKTFVIGIEGITKPDEIKEGDVVTVTDSSKCYSTFEEFMLQHKSEITKKVFWNFMYDRSYKAVYATDSEAFRVHLIAPHPDKNYRNLAIISNGECTFIFDVRGLKKTDIPCDDENEDDDDEDCIY